ncbi:MAG TPA: hypothetical protein VJU84_08765 [Pyrinomonadaceae bacterium]|nr:hypothetical protein [Pyrinomonadaceae bacterium]
MGHLTPSDELQQQLIEELILQPRTASRLAYEMRADLKAVAAALDAMKVASLVAPAYPYKQGDAYCKSCRMELEGWEPGECCGVGFGGECTGWPVDLCVCGSTVVARSLKRWRRHDRANTADN